MELAATVGGKLFPPEEAGPITELIRRDVPGAEMLALDGFALLTQVTQSLRGL
jgi:hypothetical protein